MIRARISVIVYYAWSVCIVTSIIGLWTGYPIPRWIITSQLAALVAFAWEAGDNARAVLRERRALKRLEAEYGPVRTRTVTEAETDDDKH